MDKFLGACNQSKLNQDDITHLNSTITCNEIKTVIKSLPTKKTPRPDGFMAEFYQIFNEELTSVLLKLFQEMEREGTLPNSFYKANITLILKPNKDVTRKENYRPISLMMQRFSTKYWQTEFNNTSKTSYTMTKLVSFQGCKQGWFNV
jgi:hypothetical protein